MLRYIGGESIGIGEKEDGVGDNNVYRKRVEPVLVSSSDLYLLLDLIFVSASRPSSNPALHCLLTIYFY